MRPYPYPSKIKSKPDILDKMVKAVPLGYAFIFFCGSLHLQFYYNTFHIPIFKFLDLTEIATSFLPIIIVITICMGSILSAFVFQKHLAKHVSKSKFYDNYWVTLVLCATCAVYIYLSYKVLENQSISFQFKSYRQNLWFVFLGFSFIVLLLTKNMQLIIANLIMVFMTAVVHESINDVYVTINNSKIKGYVITTTENDSIITDSTLFFVNRTHNYIFLYSTANKDYKAIPLSDVKKIDFKNHQ